MAPGNGGWHQIIQTSDAIRARYAARTFSVLVESFINRVNEFEEKGFVVQGGLTMALVVLFLYVVMLFFWLRQGKKGIAFEAGKLFRESHVAFLLFFAIIPIILLAVGLFTSDFSPAAPTPKPAAVINPKFEAARLKSQADALKAKENVQAALKLKCVDQIDSLIKVASEKLKKNDPYGAESDLEKCTGTMIDPKAIALLEKSSKLRVADQVKQQEKQDRIIKAEKKKKGVYIGMTKQDVLDSSWGKPERVSKTTTAFGETEIWHFSGGFLYFVGDSLNQIHN